MPPGFGPFVTLGAHRWPLARQRDGTPLYRQTTAPFFPASISEADLSDAQVSPENRVPYTFRDLSGGGGQSEVPLRGESRAYDRLGDAEGEGVDASLSPEGPVLLAAELNTVTPPTNTATDNLLGVLWQGGATDAAFAMGRYVYSWDGTAFSALGDLGVGLASSDGLLAFRGVQTADTWYAPVGSSATLRASTDSGATWAAISTGGGITNVIAALVLDGEVIVAQASPRQGAAMVCSFDDGGTAPTAFGVIDPVGDPAFPITGLIAYQNRVLVLKDGEGVFLLTSSRRTLEQELWPELRGATLYGHGATVWRGLLWLPTSRGLYAISPALTLQQVGPEVTSIGGRVSGRGRVTAVAGDSYHLYAVRYAGTTVASLLYKANVTVSGGGVDAIAWHPFLQLAAGAQAASLWAGSPGGNGPKLLLDRETAAGAFTLSWLKTPANGRDPRADQDYAYCAGGTLYYSRLAARFPGINKGWYSATPLLAPLNLKVDGQTSTSAQSARLRYKLDTTALTGASPFGYTQGTSDSSTTGRREDFTLRSRALDVAVRLATTDDSTSPQLYATTVEYDLQPAALFRHEFTLDLTPGAVGTQGRSLGYLPLPPGRALAYLRSLPGSGGALTLVDPWDNGYDVVVPINGLLPRAGSDVDTARGGALPLLVDVVAVEKHARAAGTWGTVGTMTWGQVAAYTWGGLLAL